MRFHEHFCRALGIPLGRSRTFYKDVLLSIIGIISFFGAVLYASVLTFGVWFWVLAGVSCLALALSTDKRGLIGILFAFAALRFAVAFLTKIDLVALPLAIACGAAAMVILRIRPWRRRSP